MKKYETRKNYSKATTLALRQARTVKRGGSVSTLTRSGHVKATGKIR